MKSTLSQPVGMGGGGGPTPNLDSTISPITFCSILRVVGKSTTS